MNWWGKLLGGAFGLMIGGPLGALLGVALGHGIDKSSRKVESLDWSEGDQVRVQAAFFTATFSVMGHIAKADGRVTRDEINLAQNIIRQMNLNDEQERAAKALFGEGKDADFNLEEVLHQFKRECHRRVNLIRMFIEIQIGTALADGELHPAEHRILQVIAENLGISRFDFERILTMVIAQQRFTQGSGASRDHKPAKRQIDEAYKALGVASNASDGEVKKAYRRLMSQHHPDKLVAKGLPEEMIKLANEKTHEIRTAYDLIMSERKRT